MSRARASPHRNADGDSPEEERGDGENTRERDRGPDYDEHCEGADPGEPAAEDRCSHDQQRGCCHRDGGCEEPSGGAHIFRVRSSSARDGSNLGMVGYPLGNRLSLNQGTIIWIGTVKGAPLLAVRMLGAEGASGAPFIDDLGRVVGILQIGLGSKDVIGQRTSGVVEGLDLVRWWGPTRAARPLSCVPEGRYRWLPAARSACSGHSGADTADDRTRDMPAAKIGQAYSVQLRASGGSGKSREWFVTPTLGVLPAGLALSTAGRISGTPTESGTFNFGIDVRDDENYSGYKYFTFNVTA